MSDAKTDYSEGSQYYVSEVVTSTILDAQRYERAKIREKKFNQNWMQHPVNINDVVTAFTPNDPHGRRKGSKWIFRENNIEIRADMSAGYLRIYDRKLKKYLRLDGTVGDRSDTHFKILKRGEME